MSTITPQQKAVVKQVIDQYQNNGLFAIDFNNATLKQFYDIQLELAGVTRVQYNQFYSTLDAAKRVGAAAASIHFATSANAHPVHSIVNLDSTDGNSFSTSALTSLPVAATNVTQTLGMYNEQADLFGTVQYNKNYQSAANCVINADGNYTGNNKSVTVIYTFSQTVNNVTVYAAEIITSYNYPENINNVSPTDVNGNNIIKVCLTRDSVDCDYRHAYNGTLSIPVKGSMNYFENIDVDANGIPVNGQSSIYLIRERDGGTPITPPNGFNFFDKSNSQTSGKNINWDLSWLTLNKPDFNSGEMVYYVFQLTLQVNGESVVAFITNAPNSVAPGQRFLNTLKIKPMEILYGCLGPDTEILLSDGKTSKYIKDMESGDTVLSEDGRILRVDLIQDGEEDQYLEITVEHTNGCCRSIVSSVGHPFCAKEGILLAEELKPGDLLRSRLGVAEVTDVKIIERQTKVYNLQLSAVDCNEVLNDDNRTMYANDLLVGDTVMQKIFCDRFLEREENLLMELEEEWHQDYLNFKSLQR